MDKKSDKELDEFVGKLLRETPIEAPSLNFTSKIMEQVETMPQNELFIYRPLIPKSVWLGLGLVLFTVILLVLLGTIEMEPSLLSLMSNDKRLNFELLKSLPRFNMPNTLVYGVIGFSFFACIQIVLIKHQFDKRFIIH